MSERNLDEPVTTFGLRELLAIAIRWRIVLLATMLAGTLAATVVALVLKPIYRSTATLLIESQDVPVSVVAAPIAEIGDERIAKIRQQILSRANLQTLIRRNGLYPELRGLPIENAMTALRDAITLDLVSAATGNGPQNANGATIAFTLSYVNRDPGTALRVADQLTDMFVKEDYRLRSEQVSGTAAFLVRRADELRDRLVDLEAKRRSIEAKYSGALPDQVAVSAQSTSSLRAEISRMDAESQGIMQQNGLLAARNLDLAPPAPTAAQAELSRAQAELDRLSAIYSDTHPDVVAARGVLARAQEAVRHDPPRRDDAAPIQAEVAAGRARVGMLSQRRASLVGELGRIDRLMSQAPQASYELNNLEREYDNLKQQYQGIRDKQLDAQVAANLQAEGKGERFSVVDRPTLPLSPVSPKRVRIVMMGVVGGIGLGIAILLAWEIAAMPVHGPGLITKLTGEAPLATIPTLDPDVFQRVTARLEQAMWWRRDVPR